MNESARTPLCPRCCGDFATLVSKSALPRVTQSLDGCTKGVLPAHEPGLKSLKSFLTPSAALHDPRFSKIDTDMHDAMFDLEEAEDHMYVMEKAMEDEECWNPDDRTQLMDVLSAIRRTETAFYDEIDDCLFRKASLPRTIILWYLY